VDSDEASRHFYSGDLEVKHAPIFNNQRVTELLKEYIAGKKQNEHLRNKIVRKTMPLIDAAISKKQRMFKSMFKNREELRQDCALRVIQAIPKFDGRRGDAFGFFWSLICNHLITQNQKLDAPQYSLSTDEAILREADNQPANPFLMPENRHILNTLIGELSLAFSSNGFRIPDRKRHRKACQKLRESIASGDFFQDRTKITRRMRRLGLNRRMVKYYVDYTLVTMRRKLLVAKENIESLHLHEGPTFGEDQ
jgi:hypothetical protein